MPRRRSLFLAGWLSLSAPGLLLPANTAPVGSRHVRENFGKLPLSFEKNQGQAPPEVEYLAHGAGYSVSLSRDGASLRFSGRNAHPSPELDLRLVGAGRPAATGGQPLDARANYFIGNDPSRWRADIPTFARVEYASVYPGIDLAYYGVQGRLEYDFIVAQGADPNAIRIALRGASQVELAADGDLLLHSGDAAVRFHRPESYQQIAGVRRTVESRYVLDSAGRVGFALASYDRAFPVVIDPALVYSTYLNGSTADQAYSIAVGPQGTAFVAGVTQSIDFPITHLVKPYFQGPALFISELSADGTSLIYSTYISGVSYGGDGSVAIAVDPAGNAHVAASSSSPNFPVKNALYGTLKGTSNAVVLKLSPSGGLLYSTYLGGSGDDAAWAIAAGNDGAAYVTGRSTSADFPVTPGAYQTSAPATAFAAKLNSTGSALAWSTYLGQGSQILPVGIAVDSIGAAYLTGYAYDANLPVTAHAAQATFGGAGDAFVSKLDRSGSRLVYSTYLGGSGGDNGIGIAVDADGHAFVAGTTASINFPVTKSAYQKHLPGGSGAFVAKLNKTGTKFLYATYLGGSNEQGATGVAVDSAGDAIVTGTTLASDFPVKDAVQPGFIGDTAPLYTTSDGGATWTPAGKGLPFFATSIVPDPSNGQSVLALIAESAVAGGLFHSSDSGLTWNATELTGTYVAGVAFASSGEAYAAQCNSLYTSADSGATWSLAGTVPVCASAMEVMAGSPATIYVGGFSPPSLAVSGDGGATWTTANIPGLPANGYVTAIAVASSSTIYLGTTSGVLSSADGGQTWNTSSLTGQVFWLVLGPSGELYADLSDMMYTSGDGGATWQTYPLYVYSIAFASNGTQYIATSQGVSGPNGGLAQEVIALGVDPQNSQAAYASILSPPTYPSFVTKLGPDGGSLVYSTYLGGTGQTSIQAVATDASGDAFVAGYTNAPDFPTTVGVPQPATGLSRDALSSFVTRIAESTPACTYSVAPASFLFYPAGGAANLTVTAPSGCAWSPSTSDSWITISNGTGPASGPLTITVAANTGARRTGTIHIGATEFKVTQAAAGCTYRVIAGFRRHRGLEFHKPAGGSATASVETQRGCEWDVIGLPDWITVTAGASGIGSGSITFEASRNFIPGGRESTIQSVAGQAVGAYQAGPSASQP